MQDVLGTAHLVASAVLASPHGLSELLLGLLFALFLLAFPLLGREAAPEREHAMDADFAERNLSWRR